jgi:hypothetical protein
MLSFQFQYPQTTNYSSLAELANTIIITLVGFVVVGAVGSMLYASFLMSTNKFDQGKTIMRWSIIGIVSAVGIGFGIGFVLVLLNAGSMFFV